MICIAYIYTSILKFSITPVRDTNVSIKKKTLIDFELKYVSSGDNIWISILMMLRTWRSTMDQESQQITRITMGYLERDGTTFSINIWKYSTGSPVAAKRRTLTCEIKSEIKRFRGALQQ